MQDVRRIHEVYYKDCTLQSKKHFIVQHSRIATAKTHSLPENDNIQNPKQRNIVITHDLPRRREGVVTNVRVCQNAFLHILNEKKDRVRRICRAYLELGIPPPEKRGGARRVEITAFRTNAVIDFIKKFRPIQSHYCRGKIKVRQYLDSSLSCCSLWKMFLAEHGLSPSALGEGEVQPVEEALNAEEAEPSEGISSLPDEPLPLSAGTQAEPPYTINKPVNE